MRQRPNDEGHYNILSSNKTFDMCKRLHKYVRLGLSARIGTVEACNFHRLTENKDLGHGQ